MGDKPPLLKRANAKNVATLCATFDVCLSEYTQSNVFGNVTEHFYHRTLARGREISYQARGSDSLFAEYSYAALGTWMTSWQDLVSFDRFQQSLVQIVEATKDLAAISILDLDGEGTEQLAAQLVVLLAAKLTTAKSESLVASSKLLHFLLPNLVPPIDRRYTLQFLFGPNGAPSGYETSELFRVVFAECVYIASRSEASIRRAVETDPRLSPGHAKVVDNAIIGFRLLTPTPEAT